jgi:hypothetical protein
MEKEIKKVNVSMLSCRCCHFPTFYLRDNID